MSSRGGRRSIRHSTRCLTASKPITPRAMASLTPASTSSRRNTSSSPQHLDELAFAAGGHACFDQATQRREFLGQGPADQWCRLFESADLAFAQSQVMQRVEDKALAFIGARMTGDHRGSTGDHHLMDIAADYHFPVAIGGRYRVVGAAIAHQRLRADPGRLLLAGVIGCWRQVLE